MLIPIYTFIFLVFSALQFLPIKAAELYMDVQHSPRFMEVLIAHCCYTRKIENSGSLYRNNLNVLSWKSHVDWSSYFPAVSLLVVLYLVAIVQLQPDLCYHTQITICRLIIGLCYYILYSGKLTFTLIGDYRSACIMIIHWHPGLWFSMFSSNIY